jgi:uncharacterized membrane protein YqjE
MATPSRSVPEVLQDIVGNIQEIIRSEFRLAKAEIKVEASKAASPIKLSLVGSVLGFYALGFLLYTAVVGLSLVVAPWLAALIVSSVLTVISLALVSAGIKRFKHVRTVPERTIETMKENVQWAKNQIK